MKLFALIACVVAFASCAQVRTVKLATGKIVKMTSNDVGIMDALRYGNYVWIDTIGHKEPYPLAGYTHPSDFKDRTAVQVEVLNKLQ